MITKIDIIKYINMQLNHWDDSYLITVSILFLLESNFYSNRFYTLFHADNVMCTFVGVYI